MSRLCYWTLGANTDKLKNYIGCKDMAIESTTRKHLSIKNIDTHGKDFIFLDEDDYDLKAKDISLNRSTFIRIGMKKAELSNSSLTQCEFISCYFRHAKFTSVDFTGSSFQNCNLEKAIFQSCNFRYAKFYNCHLNVDEIIACLPTEPNLRLSLARNLRMNFQNIGDKNSAEKLLNIEIKAHEQDLISIFLSKTGYYRSRYDMIDRFKAGIKLLLSKLSGLVWGYGIRIDRLIFSYLTLIFACTLITYFGHLKFQNSNNIIELDFWNSLYITSSSFVLSGTSVFTPASWSSNILILLDNLLGTIFLALLVSTLFKKISK